MAAARSSRWREWFVDHPWVWVVALAALLPLTWFAGAYLITGTDINFPLDPVWRFVSRFSLWDPSFIAGRDQSVALPTQVFASIQALLAALHLGNTLVEKLELVFWLAASGCAGVFFLAQLFAEQEPRAKRSAITLGTTVYLFNLFLVNRLNEIDVATLGAYVFIPAVLGFSLAVAGGRLPAWRAALGTVLASVIGVGLFANPPLVLVVAGFLAAFTVVIVATNSRPANRAYFKFLCLFAVGFIAVHLWWIVPYVWSLNVLVGGNGGGGLGNLNLLSWVDGVSRHTTLWNVVRMQGAWDWYERGIADKPYFPAALHYQRNGLLIALSLLLPLGALASFKGLRTLDRRGRALWWLFGLTLLVSLIYSMGTNNLFSRTIYGWTARIVPYFSLVRSPWYKFGYLTVLGYTVLIGVLGLGLMGLKSAHVRRWIIGGLALGLIIYAFPFLLGRTQLFPYTRLSHAVPAYAYQTTAYLNTQKDTHRVVTIPQEEAYNYTWGYGSGGDILGDLLHRSILSNETFTGGNRQGADLLLDSFYHSLYDTISPDSVRLLDYLDGGWFIHKNDSKYNDYGRTDSPQFIHDRLSQQTGIVLDRTFAQWDIYRRTTPPPGRIVTSTRLWTIYGDPSDTLKVMPYFLKDLPADQFVQFYTRKTDQGPGPGTTRSVLAKDLPYLDGQSLIRHLDFGSPFVGHVRTERLLGGAHGSLDLNGVPVTNGGDGTLKTQGNTLEIKPERLANKLRNPTFTAPVELGFPGPGPWNFSDSSKTAPGQVKFSIAQVPGSDGSPALQLSATNHILALHQTVPDFEPRAVYHLSFDYRHVQGQAPSFATWQATSAIDTPNGQLPSSSEWQHYETYIQTDPRSTGLLVYLYAGAKLGETTINEYDNVKLEKLGTRTTYTFLSDETSAAPAPGVTVSQQSPTRWAATVAPSTSAYLLSFLETYNPGWEARVDGQLVKTDRHVEVDGYANGWWLPASNHPVTVTIQYRPQRIFTLIGWISLFGLAGIGGLFWADWKRRRIARFRTTS